MPLERRLDGLSARYQVPYRAVLRLVMGAVVPVGTVLILWISLGPGEMATPPQPVPDCYGDETLPGCDFLRPNLLDGLPTRDLLLEIRGEESGVLLVDRMLAAPVLPPPFEPLDAESAASDDLQWLVILRGERDWTRPRQTARVAEQAMDERHMQALVAPGRDHQKEARRLYRGRQMLWASVIGDAGAQFVWDESAWQHVEDERLAALETLPLRRWLAAFLGFVLLLLGTAVVRQTRPVRLAVSRDYLDLDGRLLRTTDVRTLWMAAGRVFVEMHDGEVFQSRIGGEALETFATEARPWLGTLDDQQAEGRAEREGRGLRDRFHERE